VAIQRQADGQIKVIEDRCIGCKMCLLACPFGVMSFSPEKGVAQNCDMCDGDPQCVQFCTPGALEFADVVAASAPAKQKAAAALGLPQA
jgi:Fe-S-cluster-containing hydrogenase component 2